MFGYARSVAALPEGFERSESFFTFRVWGPGFRVCRSPKP